jgi:WD40 repeat protein
MIKTFRVLFFLLFLFGKNVHGQSISIGTPQLVNQVNCSEMAISPDASYILTLKRYGAGVQLWRQEGISYKIAEVLGDYGASGTFPQRFAITSDGGRFAVANTDNSIFVFDMQGDGTFKKVQTVTPAEDIAMHMAFSPDDKLFIAEFGGKVKFFRNERELKEISQSEKGGLPLFIPSSNLLLIGEYLYEYTSAGALSQVQEMDKIAGNKLSFSALECVAASQNGNYLATMDHYKVALYERKGKKYSFIKDVEVAKDFKTLSFSADDKYLVGCDDNFAKSKVFLYEIVGGKLEKLADYAPLKEGLESALFTNDGKFLVTGTNSDMSIYPVKGVPSIVKNTRSIVRAKPSKQVRDPQANVPQRTPPTVTKPVTTNVTNNIVNIFWINPNPDILDDKPIVTDKATIEIQVKVISDKPLNKEDITIIINGKKEQQAKFNEVSLKQKANTRETGDTKSFEYTFVKKVLLPDQDNVLQVACLGNPSKQKVRVVYNGGKPTLHILAIGTSLDLQFPKKDAQDFAKLFNAQGGKNKIFASVETRTLVGKDATTNAIKEAVEFYKYQFKSGSISPNDIILVFISSHGFMYQNKFRIQGDDYKEIYKETYSVAYDELVSRLNEVDCKKLIFLDACFSGGAKATTADINEAIVNINSQHNGTTTFSSCSNDEYSYEDESWNNGAFTKAIVEGCTTAAADADKNGIITIGELYKYVKTKVPAMVMDKKHKSQHPTMPVTDLLENTPVFVVQK